MARASTTTSHLVLGMIAAFGPLTSYQLERLVAGTVANFWLFPHSQLYAEPRRLVAEGLLSERRETGGRRRRVYRITRAGRARLAAWLVEPEPGYTEVRDPGMLKLFFASQAPVARERLAEDQARAHRARGLEYRQRLEQLSAGRTRTCSRRWSWGSAMRRRSWSSGRSSADATTIVEGLRDTGIVVTVHARDAPIRTMEAANDA